MVYYSVTIRTQEALDPSQLRKLTARVWSSAAIFDVRNQPGVSRPPLPARTYRGGSLPRSKHFFFCAGRQYRQPTFLSSTANIQQAHDFMQERTADGSLTSKTDAVLWTFVFDPRLGCNHINLIDRHDGTLGGDANQVTPTSETHAHTAR
jgi:hypothetical protein